MTEKYLSNCCNAPATEPGYPDSDVCSKCKEHAGFELEEFNLGDKIFPMPPKAEVQINVLFIQDVREFIKIVEDDCHKECLSRYKLKGLIPLTKVYDILKKRAGPKLIVPQKEDLRQLESGAEGVDSPHDSLEEAEKIMEDERKPIEGSLDVVCKNCGKEKFKHHSYIYCNPHNDKKFKPKEEEKNG